MALTNQKSSSGRKNESKSSKRKIERRIKFHAKVQDATSSLGAKKTIKKKRRLRRQKKLKAYDLSALSEFFPDLGASQQATTAFDTKLNCKSRQKLVQRESAQLRAVLNNPAFQMDPVAAIQRHLESTQPPSTTAPQGGRRDKQGKAKKKSKAAKKKKKKKGSQSPIMMDLQ